MKKYAFRPDSLDGLESRLVLSTVSAGVPTEVRTLREPPGSVMQALSRPASNREASRFEVGWMREMVSHHGMAIRMARLALVNSENPEVGSLARGIIRAQTGEIGQLQAWLAGGYGVSGVRPIATADDREMLRELRGQTGMAFDRAFLSMMIEHHQAAVEDADELLDRGFHPRLLQLGRDIIATQTQEVGQMRRLLAESGGPMPGGGGPVHHGM
jgi:uncharacterized protein (DUF305 family)